MANNFTLMDYSITDGVFKGIINIDNIDANDFTPRIFLRNIKYDLTYNKVTVSKCENKTCIFSVDFKDEELQMGTWYPVVLIYEKDYLLNYGNLINTKGVGRMIELSSDKLYFDPDMKIHYMGALDKDSIFVIRKWGMNNPGISKSVADVTGYNVKDNQVEFSLKKMYDKPVFQAEVWLLGRAVKQVKRIQVSSLLQNNETFTVDFSDISVVGDEECNRLWEVFLVINLDGTYRHSRIEIKGEGEFSLYNIRKSHADESSRFLITKPVRTNGNEAAEVMLYFNKQGRLCCKSVPKLLMYKEMYRAKMVDFNVKKNIMSIRIKLSRPDFINKKLILRSFDEASNEYTDYYLDSLNQESGRFILDLKNITWDRLKYEFILLAGKEEETYEFRVICGGMYFAGKLAKVYKYAYETAEGKLVYIAKTIGDKLIIESRPKNKYDGLKYRFNEKAALLLGRAAKLFYFKRNLLLFYEKFCTAAQDNSFYMFEYFVTQQKNKKVRKRYTPRYIIEEDSNEYRHLRKKYGSKIVPFMGIRHLLYLQAAKMFVSTDSKRHCYRWRSGATKLLKIIEDKSFVFLQHGVLGFKRVEDIYSSQYANKASMFITSSEYEKEIVERCFGYDRSEIEITGLARWDKLTDKSEGKRMAFYMPTWRKWIFEAETEEFLASDYYKAYMEILNSDGLSAILAANNMEMIFCMHPKFSRFSDKIESKFDNIKIVAFDDCKINELIMQCSMFITDYSSASWDAFYMKKPVLFYQFDVEKYMRLQGAYINFEKGLFGYRVTAFEEFLQKINYIAQNDFIENINDEKLRDKFLPLRDGSNRQRIYDKIIEKL